MGKKIIKFAMKIKNLLVLNVQPISSKIIMTKYKSRLISLLSKNF